MIREKLKMELFATFLVVLFHFVNSNEALHQIHIESKENSNGHRFARDLFKRQSEGGIFYRRGDKILECFPNGECEVVDVVVPDDEDEDDIENDIENGGLGDGSEGEGDNGGLGDGSEGEGENGGLGDGSEGEGDNGGLGAGSEGEGDNGGLGDGSEGEEENGGLGDGSEGEGDNVGLGDGSESEGAGSGGEGAGSGGEEGGSRGEGGSEDDDGHLFRSLENNNEAIGNQPNADANQLQPNVVSPAAPGGTGSGGTQNGGKAVCEFQHSSKVEGSILLIEEFSQSPMDVLGKLKGLDEGTYVLTFHTNGDVESGGCRGIGPYFRPQHRPFVQKRSIRSSRRSHVRSRRGIELFKLGKRYMIQAYESCVLHVDLCQKEKLSQYTCKKHLARCTEILKCRSCRENAKKAAKFETLADLEKTVQVEYKTDIPKKSLTIYTDEDGLANIAEVEKEQTMHGSDSVIGRSILISAVPEKEEEPFEAIACCRIEAGGPTIIV